MASRLLNHGDEVDGVDVEVVDMEEVDGEVGDVSDELWMKPPKLLQKISSTSLNLKSHQLKIQTESLV